MTAWLEGPGARGAFLLRVTMAPPWGIEIRDSSSLTVLVMGQGRACLAFAEEEPTTLAPGDVALIRGPEPYRVRSAPDAPTRLVILPGQRCEDATGSEVELSMRHGVRSWGNSSSGDQFLLGSYLSAGELGKRLLELLPPVVVVRDGENSAASELLAREIADDNVAQAALLDRLLDVVLIEAVRHWAADRELPELERTADAAVEDSLKRMHTQPELPWSVTSLADAAGLSRAAYARRFSAATGTSPMAYLTALRLDQAADRLTGTPDPIGTIAVAVGYDSPFSFSAAFTRRFGRSPKAFRERQRELAAAGARPTRS